MLRRGSRSVQKDQNMETHHSSFSSHRNINNSPFTVAGLFLGQGPKLLSDCDSVMSPTSPLDLIKFPRSPFKTRKSWDRGSKVGLSIVDSLDGNAAAAAELGSTAINESRYKPVFGPQMGIRTSTLVSKFDTEEFASKSLDTFTPGSKTKSSIFEVADALVGPDSDNLCSEKWTNQPIDPESDFLRCCYSCYKELAGKDIYIYRGEKAFCSPSCRELEIVDDEGEEETADTDPDAPCVGPEAQ